nr:site-specific integrase [Secundilactobacillus folii]
MTYQQAYDGWLTEYVNTVRESTLVKTMGYFKNHILPAFGKRRIDKITIPYTQSVVNDWAKDMTKYKTILNYAGAVFQYAIKLDIIEKDPTKFVVRPAIKQTVNQDNWFNFYDKNELKRFLACLADEDRQNGNHQTNTLFRLLAFTGIRKGEALALTWKDVNFTKRTLNINKALTRGKNSRLYVHFPKTVN